MTKTNDIVPQEKLDSIVNQLFSMLQIDAKYLIEKDEENDALLVNIEAGDEAGLLIGNRGRTLASLQTILSLIYRQQTNNWIRILVNVADWREKEQSRLIDLANHTAERVRSTGQEQYLYNLTPSQRRIIHMELSQENDLQTESQGEGKERYLVVSPKK